MPRHGSFQGLSGWAWPIESWAERPIASAPACRHDRRSGGLPALAARLQGRERCNSLNTERQRDARPRDRICLTGWRVRLPVRNLLENVRGPRLGLGGWVISRRARICALDATTAPHTLPILTPA